MKIIIVSDKEGSAIWRLAQMNVNRMKHLQVAHLAIHPKRPEPDRVEAFRRLLADADLVHFEYYKSAVTLRKLVPEIEKKKLILTHHNEHGLDTKTEEWARLRWDRIIVKNKWQQQTLAAQGIKAVLIKHAAEMDALPFARELTTEKVVGYVGQIKKVKGVRELKQACDELGYRLLVVGKPSEAEYFDKLDKNNLLLMSDVPDAGMSQAFHRMRVYCANSDDGTESGTVPILEAMASGIPVVTRRIGLVRDCGENGKNMMIREGGYTDISDLKDALRIVMENDDIAEELRENAWRTVRQYHPDIQARETDRLYRKVLHDSPSVSVVIPTCDRAATLVETLNALSEQTFPNFEVVVVDDGTDPATLKVVEEARKLYGYPIRYHKSVQIHATAEGAGWKDYGLARARNIGIMEATGDIVVFCDDRLRLHPEAIGKFVKKLQSLDSRKAWTWGAKGGVFKSFVENFSATWRRQLIDGGMFCERIDEYGGTTQEISARVGAQGFKFEFSPEAAAEPIMGTHSKSNKREQIVRMKLRLYKLGFQ